MEPHCQVKNLLILPFKYQYKAPLYSRANLYRLPVLYNSHSLFFIFISFTSLRQSCHIRQTPEMHVIKQKCSQNVSVWHLTASRHSCCGSWISCQGANLESFNPWLQLSSQPKGGQMGKMTVNHRQATVKTCQLSNSRCCSGSYAGQHINETPLELEMSKKLKREELQAREPWKVEPWEHVEGGEFIGILILQKSIAPDLPATNIFILILPVWVEHTAPVKTFFMSRTLSLFFH